MYDVSLGAIKQGQVYMYVWKPALNHKTDGQ